MPTAKQIVKELKKIKLKKNLCATKTGVILLQNKVSQITLTLTRAVQSCTHKYLGSQKLGKDTWHWSTKYPHWMFLLWNQGLMWEVTVSVTVVVALCVCACVRVNFSVFVWLHD